MKNVILFQPSLGIIDLATREIPLSLLSICRTINDDYDIVIVDQRLDGWEDRLQRSLSAETICVGFTCMTGIQVYFAGLLAQSIKQHFPSVPLVFGGIHPTLSREQAVAEPYIDYVISGEGDLAFGQLVRALDNCTPVDAVPGISFRRGATTVITPGATVSELDQLQPVPYELIDLKDYEGLAAQNWGIALNIEAGRGCPHNCNYCHNPVFSQRRWRGLSAEAVLKTLDHVSSVYGIDGFFLVDCSFFTNPDRARLIANGLIDNNVQIEWCCEVNLADVIKMSDEDWQLFFDSGMRWLAIGIESASPAIQARISKRIAAKDVFTIAKKAASYGICLKFNFMTGFLWETDDDVKMTVELAWDLINSDARIMLQPFYICVPFPGTAYLKECTVAGLDEPQCFIDWYTHDPFLIHDHLPWLKGKIKQRAIMLMYTSYFIDNKVYYNTPGTGIGRLTQLLGTLYRPIARLRFRHLFHHFFFEQYIFKAYYAWTLWSFRHRVKRIFNRR